MLGFCEFEVVVELFLYLSEREELLGWKDLDHGVG